MKKITIAASILLSSSFVFSAEFTVNCPLPSSFENVKNEPYEDRGQTFNEYKFNFSENGIEWSGVLDYDPKNFKDNSGRVYHGEDNLSCYYPGAGGYALASAKHNNINCNKIDPGRNCNLYSDCNFKCRRN